MFDSDIVNLILKENAMAISVPSEGMEIGRSASCLLQLDDPNISRRHARIVCGEPPLLVDLASKNGTYVNDELLQGSRELHDGDTIRLGERVLIVRIVANEAAFEISENQTNPTTSKRLAADLSPQASGTDTGLGAIGRLTLDQTCPSCGVTAPVNAATCTACGYRWPKGRPKASTQQALPAADSRRREERRAFDLDALYSSGTLLGIPGTLENISSEGLFIRTAELDSIDSFCTIEVRDTDGSRLSLSGFVRHVLRRGGGGKKGMGLEFAKLSEPAKAWIERVLRQLDGLD